MSEFRARRHRLELPPMPNSDDPAALKRAFDQMKRLVQDEFNRLSTDYYDFKKATFEAGIIPLRAVANIAVTKTQFSMSATWELPDGQTITPTQVRIRIPEISDTWLTYTYPKTSFSFSGLLPATQYTLQIQLRATFEATDSFVSTTRNCPSVPVLRTAESPIRSKVFTTDTGVGPPTDNGTTDTNVIFTFPDTAGTPGTVDGSDCWWGYKFQYRTACAWADTVVSEAFAAGNVGDVTIDTGAVPFTTYPDTVFRIAYREICNGVAQDWVYGEPFMAVDYAEADCLGISKNASSLLSPFTTASLFALPSVCQADGTNLQIVDELSETEFFPNEPGFKCIEYIDNEWTLIADDTTDTAISNTIFTGLLSGEIPAIANFNAETDFTLTFEVKIQDNSFYQSLGEREAGVTLIDIGGRKIRAFVIQKSGDYSIEIQVPRDGGGQYAFRADGCDYGAWVNIYYVHDVSEADGRILYKDGVEVGRSANAIANDFDGITGEVQINTYNDMNIRKIYAWDEAIDADTIADLNTPYAWSSNTGATADNATATTITVAVGDLVVVGVWQRELGSFGSTSAPNLTGTATLGTTTRIITDVAIDTLGVSDGKAAVFAALVTGAGDVKPDASSNCTIAAVVIPAAQVDSSSGLTSAIGTTASLGDDDPGTGPPTAISLTVGAATGGAGKSTQIMLVGGGGGNVDPPREAVWNSGTAGLFYHGSRVGITDGDNYTQFGGVWAGLQGTYLTLVAATTAESMSDGGYGIFSVEVIAP